MSTHPQPSPLGGPRTEEGKAASSQNAVTHGLFATRDFTRPGEQDEYEDLVETLQIDLLPTGPLEQILVDEIRHAMWRLRRCSQIEENFAAPAAHDNQPDPMQQESTAALQLSVDRARSLSHRLLHKCTAELRKLQTERLYRDELFVPGTDISHLGLADLASAMKNIHASAFANLRRKRLGDITALEAVFKAPMPPPPAEPGSFCKTPRNAQCPCKSGLKYKRCCGKDAPAVLHAAQAA